MRGTDRTERARIAANERWARPGAREAQSRTLAAVFRARLVAEVDPDGVMGPEELEAALVNARRAIGARLRAAKGRGMS
jgi:hypothetical protein